MGLEEQFIHISPIEMPEWMASDCAQIAENFAIGFMEWALKNQDMEFECDDTINGVKQLLEIYKKKL